MSLKAMVRAATVVSLIMGSSVVTKVQARDVTDITGHVVQVPDHPKRIVLGEGRLIYALEPLEKEKLFERVVGWQGEFRSSDTAYYKELVAKFPQAAKVSVIGRSTADTISPERILDLHPDLVIFSTTGHGPGQSSEVTTQLRAAHIPIVFIDFRQDPVKNTAKSMTILGQALDRQKEAAAFTDFYEKRLSLIESRVKDVPVAQRPRVFIYMLAGQRPTCCHTAGKGNMGAFIEAAGGENVAAPMLPGYLGDISVEALMTLDPDILLLDGTKGPEAKGSGLRMGAGVTQEMAYASFENLLKLPELSNLKAVHQKKTYGIWHTYYDNPFNILAVEVMAKWFYPDKFKDLDPDSDLRTMQTEFTALPPGGTYWIGNDAH
ncbi:ABC transporter substrate-binding protein [Acetobacteraceae bacterium ESL0709]|nr:ABC transporter substrate-binding protein [Acetobacteraceae bacterium ESL0697]MDF7677812.1 ABC transporter substrate-binding protein [Acetobacteraceae bacterium ESL0709]